MLHFIHNGKAVTLLNQKAISLESLVSIEIEHLKAQTLICGIYDTYSPINKPKENLYIVAAQATYGEVQISLDSKSLLYIYDHQHNRGDVLSYTVKNDTGCVGSLALVIRDEHDITTKEPLKVDSDEIVSSIVLRVTYKEGDVIIVDRFSIDINTHGKGVLSPSPNNRNFEISHNNAVLVDMVPKKRQNRVFIDKSLVDNSFFVSYDEKLLAKQKPKRRTKRSS